MYDLLDLLIWGRKSRAWQRLIYGEKKPVIRRRHRMKGCYICESVYGPIERDSYQELQTFKGYTVDFRLRSFRTIPADAPPEFIDFESVEGMILCAEMHEAAIKQLNKQLGKTVFISI